MSQAYTTVDEWKEFSSAFEKFSDMVATLTDSRHGFWILLLIR
jgi:hypothetical protein